MKEAMGGSLVIKIVGSLVAGDPSTGPDVQPSWMSWADGTLMTWADGTQMKWSADNG